MRDRKTNIATLIALSAAAMVAGSPVVSQGNARSTEMRESRTAAQQQPVQAQTRATSQNSVGFAAWWRAHRATQQRRDGPGWTVRQVQRMARKKRNQARHRKACRG